MATTPRVLPSVFNYVDEDSDDDGDDDDDAEDNDDNEYRSKDKSADDYIILPALAPQKILPTGFNYEDDVSDGYAEHWEVDVGEEGGDFLSGQICRWT